MSRTLLLRHDMTTIPLSHASLKQQHRVVRNDHPSALTLRIHRSLSWLNRAEQAEDIDGKFIFLWIAFNAAYAQEFDDIERASDKATFNVFLDKICELDTDNVIENLVWNEFSGSIRVLLDNPFVFHHYWEYRRGRINEGEWISRFDGAKKSAQRALADGNTTIVLSIIFNRMYTLRNQLIHGGATWDGSVNRDQLRDCTRLLAKLAPLIISVMMSNPGVEWGEAVYPVVDSGS